MPTLVHLLTIFGPLVVEVGACFSRLATNVWCPESTQHSSNQPTKWRTATNSQASQPTDQQTNQQGATNQGIKKPRRLQDISSLGHERPHRSSCRARSASSHLLAPANGTPHLKGGCCFQAKPLQLWCMFVGYPKARKNDTPKQLQDDQRKEEFQKTERVYSFADGSRNFKYHSRN